MESSKRAKLQEEEEIAKDRISDLPDHIIHRILSLLPSTKEAVQTGVLSKRWVNQWTQVSVLMFYSDTFGMSSENFLQFIDHTLIHHDFPKIERFWLRYRFTDTNYPQFNSSILFATRKSASNIFLRFTQEYILPEFLFEHAPLVRLHIGSCICMPNGNVNWKCLTILLMKGVRLTDQAVDLILSGSPQLKALYLRSCVGFQNLVVASKSLIDFLIEQVHGIFDIKISSCPMLETVALQRCLNVRSAKLLNLPSLHIATIKFHHHEDECKETRTSLIKDILNQLRRVKDLNIGDWFMENMSAILVGGQFSPVFKIKRSTLECHDMSAIVRLLRNSPVLHILHIDVTRYDQDSRNFEENYLSGATVFKVSHLHTISIKGFPKSDDKRKVMLNFVQFVLKKAKVLKKIFVKLIDDESDFPLKVSQELLSIPRPRRSRSAIIKVVCFNSENQVIARYS